MKKSNSTFALFALIAGGVLLATSKSAAQSVSNDLPSSASGSRGLRNNNPGNIIINPSLTFAGEIQPSTDGKFKQFKTMGYGYRAMFKLLNSYVTNGYNTISKIIHRWAPASDGNDPEAYTNFVAKFVGVDPNAVVGFNNPITMQGIVKAISQVENQKAAVSADVSNGYVLFLDKSISGMGLYDPDPNSSLNQARRSGETTIQDSGMGALLNVSRPVKSKYVVSALEAWSANGRRIVFANSRQVDDFVHNYNMKCGDPNATISYCDASFCYDKKCSDIDKD